MKFPVKEKKKLPVYIVQTTQQKTNVPLLPPSGPLSIVHSSILPKGAKSCRTSSSVCCLLSIPANSFLSAQTKRWQLGNFNCCTANNETASSEIKTSSNCISLLKNTSLDCQDQLVLKLVKYSLVSNSIFFYSHSYKGRWLLLTLCTV